MRLIALCEDIRVYSQVRPEEFFNAIQRAQQSNPRMKENLHLHSLQDYAKMRTFLSQDKTGGYALKSDGELVNVFSLVRGAGNEIVRNAVQNGAKHLDCFDGYLPTLYGRHGFKEYKREPNWTPGGPDVVFMRR